MTVEKLVRSRIRMEELHGGTLTEGSLPVVQFGDHTTVDEEVTMRRRQGLVAVDTVRALHRIEVHPMGRVAQDTSPCHTRHPLCITMVHRTTPVSKDRPLAMNTPRQAGMNTNHRSRRWLPSTHT